MVSVITLTYKDYTGLFTTIASVLCQNCGDFEYIISDDGSEDFPKQEVEEYINQYKRPNLIRFEVIKNVKNVGTVKHLNNVIKKCNGEYIFELSCKDYFVNTTVITDIISVFEKEACDVLVVNRVEYGKNVKYRICPHYRDWKKIEMMDTKIKRYSALMLAEHYDMFIGPNVIYKKSAIVDNGFFDEGYVLFEDAPMIAKFIWNNNVCIRPDLFAYAYDCETGISAPGKRNPILSKDIKKYNLYGKLEHYDELPSRVQNHIKFGIEREQSKNCIHLALICIKYCPRIFEYLIYNIGQMLHRFGDYKVIKHITITDFDKEIKQ